MREPIVSCSLGGVKVQTVSQFRRGPPALTTYGVKVELVSRCLSVGEKKRLATPRTLTFTHAIFTPCRLDSCATGDS